MITPTMENSVLVAIFAHAKRQPEKIALRDADRVLSYAELLGKITTLANWLRALGATRLARAVAAAAATSAGAILYAMPSPASPPPPMAVTVDVTDGGPASLRRTLKD